MRPKEFLEVGARAQRVEVLVFLQVLLIAHRLPGGYPDFMYEVTRILSAIEAGDPHAAADLLPFVSETLRGQALVLI